MYFGPPRVISTFILSAPELARSAKMLPESILHTSLNGLLFRSSITRPVKLKPAKEELSRLIVQLTNEPGPGPTSTASSGLWRSCADGITPWKTLRTTRGLKNDFRLVTSNAKILNLNPRGGLDQIAKTSSAVIQYKTDWNIEIRKDDNAEDFSMSERGAHRIFPAAVLHTPRWRTYSPSCPVSFPTRSPARMFSRYTRCRPSHKCIPHAAQYPDATTLAGPMYVAPTLLPPSHPAPSPPPSALKHWILNRGARRTTRRCRGWVWATTRTSMHANRTRYFGSLGVGERTHRGDAAALFCERRWRPRRRQNERVAASVFPAAAVPDGLGHVRRRGIVEDRNAVPAAADLVRVADAPHALRRDQRGLQAVTTP
ncbi:hypothetical protein B0H11DRAFT_1931987 [Mycena galericulata]|nr:hypothetical protein B0H11DRAFT_1931987 [Mycena galericulata]